MTDTTAVFVTIETTNVLCTVSLSRLSIELDNTQTKLSGQYGEATLQGSFQQ